MLMNMIEILKVLTNILTLVPIVFGSDRHLLYLQYLRNTLRLKFDEGIQMLKVRGLFFLRFFLKLFLSSQ